MENINNTVKTHLDALKNSGKTMSDIYKIMFSMPNKVMTERAVGYKIEKQTYAEIKERIEVLSKKIITRFSAIEKGSYIGIYLENSPYYIVLFWAILKSGYKPLLLNTKLPDTYIKDIISMVEAKEIVGENCSFVTTTVEQLDKIEPCSEIKNGNFENEIALSTSATSMNVKVCVYDGNALSEQILTSEYVLKKNNWIKKHNNGELKLLAFLPFYHIFGLVSTFLWFGFFGRTFVFLKDYMPETISLTCRKHQVTHIFGVPILWNTVVKEIYRHINAMGEKTLHKFNKGLRISLALQSIMPNFSKIIVRRMFRQVTSGVFGNTVKFCISGGSYIPQSTLRIINAIGYPLYNGYGATEIGITSVVLTKNAKKRCLPGVGNPIDSIKYKLIPESGEKYQLAVSAKSMCKTVISKCGSEEMGEWFYTGDIAHCDKNGYYIDGRISDLIVGDNGENILPDEIERCFSLSRVDRFCVLGINFDGAEKVTLIIEIKNPSSVAVNEIMKEVISVNAELPSVYRLSRVYFTEQAICPQNAIKVNRKYLKKIIDEEKIELFDYTEYQVRTDAECIKESEEKYVFELKQMFAEVLNKNISEINISANFFFELGGSSLDYMSLMSLVSKRFGISPQDIGGGLFCVRDFGEMLIKKGF